jgi:hypothetical protein
MNSFFSTVLATAFANICSFLIYQGFVHSKIGSNFREEISRFFNKIFHLWRKSNV